MRFKCNRDVNNAEVISNRILPNIKILLKDIKLKLKELIFLVYVLFMDKLKYGKYFSSRCKWHYRKENS